MSTQTKLITADELLAMPRDGNRYELIRGVLIRKMPTGDHHGDTTALISYFITQYTFETGSGATRVGEPGYRLESDPDTVRAPDIAWFATNRVPTGTQGYPEVVPDLAVEVKSPSNSNPEMAAKARMWLSYGSRMVAVADPQHSTFTVFRPDSEPVVLSDNDIFDGDDVMLGFSCPVWRFFRRER